MLINNPNTIFLVKPSTKIEHQYIGYSQFYDQLSSMLKQYGHTIISLAVSDIWIRDFAPFFTDRGYIPLTYQPPYQHFDKSAKVQKECLAFFDKIAVPLPLRFDGGNLVTNNSGIGIATRKPLELNKLSEDQMNLILHEVFDIQKMVWLTPEPYERTAHADGIVQFLDDNTLCINAPNSEYLQKVHKLIQKQCPQIKLISLPYHPSDETTYGWYSANGIYVNFLQTSKVVIVPTYNLPTDEVALKIIQSHTSKPVVGLNASTISKYGGSIHCVTSGY